MQLISLLHSPPQLFSSISIPLSIKFALINNQPFLPVLLSFTLAAIFSLQLGAGEHSGRRPERHNHRGHVGAPSRRLRHHHRLVHRHLPEAAGPRPEPAGLQDGRGPGRGMKYPSVCINPQYNILTIFKPQYDLINIFYMLSIWITYLFLS